MCSLLNRFLTKSGFEVDTAQTANSGIEKFKSNLFDIVLCDYRLGDKKDGKDVLLEIKQLQPTTIVLIITGTAISKRRLILSGLVHTIILQNH